MATDGNIEYAATRVQAQHGRLPTESDWQALEGSQDLPHYLDSARAGPLAPWVATFDPGQDLHVIERSLRTQWRGYVERVASWHPHAWQPWLRWLAWLPTLPLLPPLARPEPLPQWLLSEPALAGLGPVGGAADRAAALESTALAPLAAALGAHVSVAALWRERWERLAPPADADTRAHLSALLKAIDAHAAALSGARSTPLLRRHLAGRLDVLFRLSSGTVVATACHLSRLALELLRLRGGLSSRCLLSGEATLAALQGRAL